MTSDDGATFFTMKRLLAATAGVLFVAKDASFPMGDGTNLEMHTTAADSGGLRRPQHHLAEHV